MGVSLKRWRWAHAQSESAALPSGYAFFGRAGVEKVLDLLELELTLTMRQCGTQTVKQITPAHVARAV